VRAALHGHSEVERRLLAELYDIEQRQQRKMQDLLAQPRRDDSSDGRGHCSDAENMPRQRRPLSQPRPRAHGHAAPDHVKEREKVAFTAGARDVRPRRLGRGGGGVCGGCNANEVVVKASLPPRPTSPGTATVATTATTGSARTGAGPCVVLPGAPRAATKAAAVAQLLGPAGGAGGGYLQQYEKRSASAERTRRPPGYAADDCRSEVLEAETELASGISALTGATAMANRPAAPRATQYVPSRVQRGSGR